MLFSSMNRRSLGQKIRPHLSWTVPLHGGMYANPRWSNPDLDPVAPAKQTWGGVDYWAYWCSDMLAPPLASTVSSVMALGFTARETIPIVFFGFLICSFVITATGKMGAYYHVPFPVIVRSVFGMYGSYPMICIRSFVALMWTAILTVQAGAFLQRCLEAIWPSFIDFPNHLPESAGITSAGILCFMLYWIIQTGLSLMPIEKLRVLFWVKGVIVPPTFLALFIWAAVVTHGGGPLVSGSVKLTSTYMNTAYSAITGLNVIIGLFSSLAVNMPDFGRFSKNNLSGYHQFLALPIIGTLGSLTPIFVTSANEYLYGSFEWYMPAVIANFDSRAAKFFVGFSFILATIGNQIAAGSYPFSNDVSGLAPRYVNIIRGTVFISIFCVVCTPWNIIKNAAGLLAFLSGYSCLMGPLAAVLCVDWYIIKGRKLNVHELYNGNGIYWYTGGFNIPAFIAFFMGFIPCLPGFAKSINNSLDIGGAWKIYTFAWLFGFVVSGSSYYVLCKFIWPQTVSLVEVAVLPAKRCQKPVSFEHRVEDERYADGVESPVSPVGDGEEKGARTKEKEVNDMA